MKPAPFQYFRPATLAETFELLAAYGETAKIIAGGQSLLPIMNMRLAHPAVLIDISGLQILTGIDVVGDTLYVRALTTHRMLETSPLVRTACPLLTDLAPFIAHLAVRFRGTLGGSLVHADPAAEWPMAVATLRGTIELASPAGVRRLSAEDFFLGMLLTALAPDEILWRVAFPVLGPGTGWAVEELSRRHGDFAMVVAAATVTIGEQGEVIQARVGLGGVGPGPVVAHTVEAALLGTRSPEARRAAAKAVVEDIDPPSDSIASAAYRRHLAAVLVHRAITRAIGRAQADHKPEEKRDA